MLALLLSGKESGVLVSNAILLFPRLLLQHQQAFEQLLGAAAAAGIQAQQQQQQACGSVPEALLMALVGLLCDAFDSIAQPLARKLAACGLAALLAFPVEVCAGFCALFETPCLRLLTAVAEASSVLRYGKAVNVLRRRLSLLHVVSLVSGPCLS